MAGQEGVKQYQTLGVVEAVDGATVTLSHDPVAELQWPAMTMDFTLPAGGLPTGIGIGSKVMFHFSVDENGSHISQIMPQGGHQ
jgi:Cu(I)/Ag(I) efflux system membrane fusion protein